MGRSQLWAAQLAFGDFLTQAIPSPWALPPFQFAPTGYLLLWIINLFMNRYPGPTVHGTQCWSHFHVLFHESSQNPYRCPGIDE